MSQIVGIICKNAIVLAAETQHTVGDSRKLTNAKKLSVVKFKNGDVIIGEVGMTATSRKAVQLIREAAADIMIESEDSVVKIAESAICQIRQDVLAGYQKRDYTLDEQESIFKSNRFGLVIAHYYIPPSSLPSHYVHHYGVPCLWTITLTSPQAERQNPFAVMGAADDLATFILKQFKCEELSWYEATCLAIDALEGIKSEDIYCGGGTEFGSVDPLIGNTPTARVGESWSQLVGRVTEKLKVFRETYREQYRTGLAAIMKEIHKENFDEAMEEQRQENEKKKHEIKEVLKRMKESIQKPFENTDLSNQN
jgi:20S proteasome alpha/beta subunit